MFSNTFLILTLVIHQYRIEKILSRLGLGGVNKLTKPLSVQLLNRLRYKFTHSTEIKAVYKNFSANVVFYVAKNPLVSVLIENNLLKQLESKEYIKWNVT